MTSSRARAVRGYTRAGTRGLALAVALIATIAVLVPTASGPSSAPPVPSGHLAKGPASVPSALSPTPLGHGVSAPSRSPPSAPSLRLGSFEVPGPHPAAWGPSGTPPGAEALGRVLDPLGPSGTGTQSSDNRSCAGLWPWGTNDSNSQSYYAPGCTGADEPGIGFYSALPGSGGNVTWNATLPMDRSPTQNQSDLYDAVWFGLTLSDQLGWMHQCFLELQFYPDELFTDHTPQDPNWTVNGRWTAAAVAWQIDDATGMEDPCFYQDLYNGTATSGPSYFNMTEGDRLSISMNGWMGSPYGENVTVRDLTENQASVVHLWDAVGNYPLDPAYSANDVDNGIQWTTGGEYPVLFSFETGHAANPVYPENNSYAACSPGKPPATPTYPSVPCPSYDASSWANDTLSPWQIGVPTFFNASAIDHPSQVAFTQTFGGVNTIPAIGGSACNGQIGSAWCSYPWYSYSCLTHAFNFGATDYPGVSDDFGQFYEWTQTAQNNVLDIYYYPPANYSIPACGQTSYTVAVGTTGASSGASVSFLSQDVASGTFPDLLPGSYSIFPHGTSLATFDHWVTSGAVSILGSPDDEWATLEVDGDGSVSADFTLTPALTTVTFDDVGTTVPGTIVVSPERTFTDGRPIGTFPTGGSISLAAGIYGVEALPSPGSNFTDWTSTGGSVSMVAVDYPLGLLDVTSAGGTATVTARYAPSPDGATMFVQVYGNGTVTFYQNTTTSFAAVNVTVGAYPISEVPAPGWTFYEWDYAPSMSMTDFAPTSNVSLENGSSWLYAFFNQTPVLENVTLVDAPASAGEIAVGGPGFAVPSGTTLAAPPGLTALLSFPASGYAISTWSVNSSSAAWIEGTGWDPNVLINASVTITATFLPTSDGNLTFVVAPASAGFIEFNDVPYFNGDYNASVGTGTHFLDAYPLAGWQLSGLSASGGASGLAGNPFGYSVGFAGPTGTITAEFLPVLEPISFAATAQTGVSLDLNGTTLGVGDTAWLPDGTYPVSLVYPSAIEQFVGWSSSPSTEFSLASSSLASTTLTLGPFSAGTIVALIDGPMTIPSFTASPAVFDLGRSTTVSVTALGGTGPLGYSFASLPPGCFGPGPTFSCTPGDPGTFSVAVTVTDVFGLAAEATATIVVNPVPSVSDFSDAPSDLDVGMSTLITTAVNGGTAPFAYTYSGLPAGCPTSDSDTLTCAPTVPGLSAIGVIVTDADGESATSAVSLNVNPAPTITPLAATRSVLDVGMPTVLSVTGTGTGALSYSWLRMPTGCASADAPTIDCTPTAAGSDPVVATLTDSIGGKASSTLLLTVAARPVAQVTVAPATVAVGATAWINVTASGGTGALTYGYAGLPSGCTSTNTSSLACVPAVSGTFTITVTVTDALHQSTNVTGTLTVTGPSGSSPGGGATALEEAEAILVVVVLATLVVIVLRRRRPPTSAPPPTDPA